MVGGGSYTENNDYQYDAHRIPWRLGLDACWNSIPSAGTTFLTDSANYFNSIETASAGGGVGNIVDKYSMSGGVLGDANPNSMSAVGCAGVGAMAANNAFMTNAYQFVLDGAYTADPKARSTAYTYFNATVGLLTALTMSGNFNSF